MEEGGLLFGVGEVEVEVGTDEGLVEEGRDALGEFGVLDGGEIGAATDFGDVDAEDLRDEGRGEVEGEEVVDDGVAGDEVRGDDLGGFSHGGSLSGWSR